MIKKITIIILSAFTLLSCSEDTVTTPRVFTFDGTFEKNINETGWIQNYSSALKDYVLFRQDSDIKHDGNFSVSIEILSNHPNDVQIFYSYLKEIKNFKPGNDYNIKGWIKSKDLKSSPYIVVQYIEKLEYVGLNYNDPNFDGTGTKDWQLVDFNFTVPENANQLFVQIGILSHNNQSSKVWFDDITIEEL